MDLNTHDFKGMILSLRNCLLTSFSHQVIFKGDEMSQHVSAEAQTFDVCYFLLTMQDSASPHSVEIIN